MERKILNYYSDDEWSDDIKFHTLNIDIDTDIKCKLHHYFLLEQCIYIYDNKINKILQIFNILDKFKKIDELTKFLRSIFIYCF
jgi:virulence-associated protein VapD